MILWLNSTRFAYHFLSPTLSSTKSRAAPKMEKTIGNVKPSLNIAALVVEAGALGLAGVVFTIFLIVYFVFLKRKHQAAEDEGPAVDHLIHNEVNKQEEERSLAAQELRKSARNMTTDELRQKWATTIGSHDEMVQRAVEKVEAQRHSQRII